MVEKIMRKIYKGSPKAQNKRLAILNKIDVQKNFISFGAYISLFPQLIAGPIVTYKSIEKDINNKSRENIKLFDNGVTRFMEGICKKNSVTLLDIQGQLKFSLNLNPNMYPSPIAISEYPLKSK